VFLCCAAAVAVARFGLPTDLSGLASARTTDAPRSLSATCVAVGTLVTAAEPDGSTADRRASLRQLTRIVDGADAESRRAFRGFPELFQAAFLPADGARQSDAMVDFYLAVQDMNRICRANAGVPAAG
jgi:hypothetical protein